MSPAVANAPAQLHKRSACVRCLLAKNLPATATSHGGQFEVSCYTAAAAGQSAGDTPLFLGFAHTNGFFFAMKTSFVIYFFIHQQFQELHTCIIFAEFVCLIRL